MEGSGGVAVIICDTTGNTVRQGSCYLAIGGYIGGITKAQSRQRSTESLSVFRWAPFFESVLTTSMSKKGGLLNFRRS